MAYKWTRNLIELLVTEYQQYENLYDQHHSLYFNRKKRDESIREITNFLKQFDYNLSEDIVKSKIYVLRGQYVKELREIEFSKRTRSNSNFEGIYKPKLWCFDQLGFLKPYCSLKKLTPVMDLVSYFFNLF